MDDGTIQFDTGPLGGGTLFAAPRATVRADTPEEVPGALAALARAQAAGGWLAGFASYELGHVFSGKLAGLMPARRDTPLLHFGVFDAPAPAPPAAPRGPVRLTPARPGWDFATYRAAFERVQAYISAGDIYQANLTFPMTARAEGAPRDLYAALAARQPVGHGALVALGGGPAILSRSPELFFEVDAAGVIETRPMKGTVPRGATPEEDRARRDWLAESEKNQAENLMIVDLLRNDISRVAALGSVQVPRMFRIESYATVHQMTSVVRARLAAGAGLPEIFAALFPCGSVTGAPKIRAMQVIHELEDGPRGIYCGAIGWAAPDGRMAFNVAIRTLSLFADGRVRFNVGGGVVHDSTAEAEYEEALWKARFAALSPGG